MALPAGLFIGQIVHYLPGVFDIITWPAPVAGLITSIDTPGNRVNLTIFQDQAAPDFRPSVKYHADANAQESSFKLTTDAAPTWQCTDEVTGAGIPDATANNFILEWTPPAGSLGVVILYREDGLTFWKVPNDPGNRSGSFAGNTFTFTDMVVDQVYRFAILNICPNQATSPGVALTAKATAPL